MKNKETSFKLENEELLKAIKEAQKDPEFIKEINKFIKSTIGIRKSH